MPEESLKVHERRTKWSCSDEIAGPRHGVEEVCGERPRNQQSQDPESLSFILPLSFVLCHPGVGETKHLFRSRAGKS